jgi:hypothetical protein
MFSAYPCLEETVKRNAEYFEAPITFSEDEDSGHVIISTHAPQTITEYGRNSRFWRWLFDTTMRNFGATGWMYSCEFLPDWKPQEIIPLSWWGKFHNFFGFQIREIIIPATGNPVETVVGFTISTYKGVVLQLSKTEFDKLSLLGLTCVKEVKGDTFPYQLRLGGNVLSVKLRK